MLKIENKILCKNEFKHTDKDEIKKEFTEKWINIIKTLEHLSQNE